MIIVSTGWLCMCDAGIDHSNVSRPEPGEWVLLLPEDPDRSAASLRKQIEAETGVRIGVVVIDSARESLAEWYGRRFDRLSGIAASGSEGSGSFREYPQITQVGLADDCCSCFVLMGRRMSPAGSFDSRKPIS